MGRLNLNVSDEVLELLNFTYKPLGLPNRTSLIEQILREALKLPTTFNSKDKAIDTLINQFWKINSDRDPYNPQPTFKEIITIEELAEKILSKFQWYNPIANFWRELRPHDIPGGTRG